MEVKKVFKCGKRFEKKRIEKPKEKETDKKKSFYNMDKSKFKKKENVTPETDLESGVSTEDIEENLNDSEVIK